MTQSECRSVDVNDVLLLNVPQTAEKLGISERKLWDLTEPRGPIPAVHIGSRVLYSPASLQRWIDEQLGVPR